MTRTERIQAVVRHLSETIGPRPPGSRAEATGAKFVAKQFANAGLDPRVETFVTPSHVAVEATLERLFRGTTLPCLPTQYSVAGDVAGTLVFLGNNGQPRQDEASLRGAIGLLLPEGGIEARIRLLERLQEEGLAGLVVISPYMNEILTKGIRFPEITGYPIVAVSWRVGNQLASAAGERFRLAVRHEAGASEHSQNVVAEIPGTGPNWLVVSAHNDTAAFAPGALDNASGTALLVELARELAGTTPAAAIRLVSTGCEEYGRRDGVGAGAQAFCEAHADELDRCVGWIEIDDVGNQLGDLTVYAAGRKPFLDLVRQATPPPHTRFPGKAGCGCDHGAAEQRGLPYVWFTDSAGLPRPCYHTPADTVEFFAPDKVATYVLYVADVVRAVADGASPLPIDREDERVLRQATFADLDAIGEVVRLAFGPVSFDRMREEFFDEELGGHPWHDYKGGGVVSSVRANIYQCLVTEIEGQVVGFATFLLDAARGIATIGNNAVHPDFQGRGIGSAQQREVDRRMREEGYTRFQVTTLTNDVPAQRMYERLGYQRIVGSINYLRQG
jgi:ribosomal protein S18 acetylase RimI-like enzyme